MSFPIVLLLDLGWCHTGCSLISLWDHLKRGHGIGNCMVVCKFISVENFEIIHEIHCY